METHAGWFLKKISEKIDRTMNETVDKSEVTFSQGRVLWYLKNHGDAPTMHDMEKFFDVSHATVSGIVSRLEEKGYVTVCADKTDRRAKNVFFTEKAEKRHREIRALHSQMEEKLFLGFSEEEKVQFASYLERVYQNLGDSHPVCDSAQKMVKKPKE